MIALKSLHFDLPPLGEFKVKNKIVSPVIIPYLLYYYRLQCHSVLSHQINMQFVTAYHLILGSGICIFKLLFCSNYKIEYS